MFHCFLHECVLSEFLHSLSDYASLLYFDEVFNQLLEHLPFQILQIFAFNRPVEDLFTIFLPPVQLKVSQGIKTNHFQSLMVVVDWPRVTLQEGVVL